MHHDFRALDLPTETTQVVRDGLAADNGCLITGPIGSGKSHAVRAAVSGATWVNLGRSSLQTTRFFVDLAREMDAGSALLEAVAQQRVGQATAVADELLGSSCLVVDRAERLVRLHSPWDDPLHALETDESLALRKWLCTRASPTVLVSRRPFDDWSGAHHRHSQPRTWSLKLMEAEGGFRDWSRLADVVDDRPGGLTLGRALVQKTSKYEFDNILVEATLLKDDGGGPTELFRFFAHTLMRYASSAWRRVLTLVGALDGALRASVEGALDEADLPALDSLLQFGLIEQRDDRLTILPVLRDFSGGAFRLEEHSPLLEKAALELLTSVNDPRTLRPADADRILRAHRIFVQLGDFERARETASLHVGGLIALARNTSRAHDAAEARRLYDQILVIVGDIGDSPTTHRRRVVSYVTHYRGFNDDIASKHSSAQVLFDYSVSIDLWSDNALWRQHKAQAHIYRGDLVGATREIEIAYQEIQPHPRRDAVLRVRPALTATRHGLPVFGLELVNTVVIDDHSDPETLEGLTLIHRYWELGIKLSELADAHGQLVVFRRPTDVSVRLRGEVWRAQIIEFRPRPGRGSTPLEALHDLSASIAAEAHELLSTPSHLLDDEQISRKGDLINHVDPLNSDLGLEHSKHRWLLGTISDDHFEPMQRRDFDPITIPKELGRESSSKGEYFARVPVHRDGTPSGPVEALRPAGSGRSPKELAAKLSELREGLES